jgi:large subunit ribosomal protein L10
MLMPGIQNENEVKQLKDWVSSAKSMVVVNYSGLKANEINSLRRQIQKVNGEMKVAKNRLIKIALSDLEICKQFDDYLNGPSAFIIAIEDEISPIKELKSFSKDNDTLEIKCGFVENEFYLKEQLMELAELPTKIQLIGMLAGVLNAPLNNFVNALAGNIRNLVNVLNRVKENKES